MHADGKANLLDSLLFKPQGQVTYQLPLTELPPACEAIVVQVSRGEPVAQVPDLVVMLRPNPRVQPGHFAVDLPQYICLRFVNWFVGAKRGGGNSDGTPALCTPACLLHDVFPYMPSMEILLSWTSRLLAHDVAALPPISLFFRSCIGSLWLNRSAKAPLELPTMRCLLAINVVFTYLHTDSNLPVEYMSLAEANVRQDKLNRGISSSLLMFRPLLFSFFSNAVMRMPCFGSPQLAHVIDLWRFVFIFFSLVAFFLARVCATQTHPLLGICLNKTNSAN